MDQGQEISLGSGYSYSMIWITKIRALVLQQVEKKIRLNGVSPDPVYTPIRLATMDKTDVSEFGKNTPMGRAAQPYDIGLLFVFLASDDSSYFTG
ncbi:glucose/ribitol dehydrogenase [Tanacetum coccineum]